MSDDSPLAPFAHEGLDPVPEPKSTIAEVSEAVKRTAHRVSGAIEAGRKPGMPVSSLRNIAREAPRGALLIEFGLGGPVRTQYPMPLDPARPGERTTIEKVIGWLNNGDRVSSY